MPKVSIIVPVYNVEKYICQCVDSILNQTYTDIELLLIDDQSSDNSPIICDNYVKKDSRVQVFHNLNSGVSSARNLGLENAKGEWIIFCDADDYWCNTYFLYNMIEYSIHNNVDIIRGEYISVNEKNEIIDNSAIKNKNSINNKTLSLIDFINQAINDEFFLVLNLIKRQLIDDIRFDVNMVFQEDKKFFLQLLNNNPKCAYINNLFYAYRRYPSSVSGSKNIKKIEDSFSLCKFHWDLSLSAKDEDFQSYCQKSAVMIYCGTLRTLSCKYYNEKNYIIKKFDLNSIQKDTLTRSRKIKNSISLKSQFIATLNPGFACIVLHYWNYIIHLMKKWNILR